MTNRVAGVPVSWNKASPLQSSPPTEIESPAGGFRDVKKVSPVSKISPVREMNPPPPTL